MFKRRNRSRRLIGTLILTALLAVAAYAFTATNVVPASQAGDGNTAITGYNVTAVHYFLLASDPSKIDYWTFDLGATAAQVQSKVVAASTTYTVCAVESGTVWKCDPAAAAEPTVLSADDLRIIATS
jgi:hypothetical protein